MSVPMFHMDVRRPSSWWMSLVHPFKNLSLQSLNISRIRHVITWKFNLLRVSKSRLFTTYVNNCLTSCNTKQSIYYSASSLYMFRVSTTHITRSTQNCNYSLQYWSYFLCSYLPPTWPAWPRWKEVAAQKYDQYRRL